MTVSQVAGWAVKDDAYPDELAHWWIWDRNTPATMHRLCRPAKRAEMYNADQYGLIWRWNFKPADSRSGHEPCMKCALRRQRMRKP